MKACAVYYLIDPRNDEVRYIGVSANPDKRFEGHLKGLGKTHRAKWIRLLLSVNLRPTFRIVAWLKSVEEAKRVEIELISEFFNLTNMTIGGDGVVGLPTEARKRIAEKLRGRTLTKEQKIKRRGWKQSEEARKKISHALIGRHRSSEHRKNLSISLKNAWHRNHDVRKSKMGGWKVSKETREKISRALKGNTNKRNFLLKEANSGCSEH